MKESKQVGNGQRILICCHDFEIGGFSSHALNFGWAFRRLGYHVSCLVMEPYGVLYSEFLDSLDEIRIVRQGLQSRNGFLRQVVETIIELRPDVVINSVVPFVQAAFPYLPAKIIRISVIHGILENKEEHEIKIALSNAPWVDAVVTVSEGIKIVVMQRESKGLQIKTIPVGVAEIPPPIQRTAAGKPLRLIFVGRLVRQKNLPSLIQIAQQLSATGIPFTLTVVGDGLEAAEFRRSVLASGLGDQIRLLGALQHAEIGKLFAQNDFFLMTSHWEGTPHALLEAMAHGLIVLVNRLPGATDQIITHGLNGFLCNATEPNSYVDIMKQLLANPGLFASVSGTARQTIVEQFSADALATNYVSLFGTINTDPLRQSPTLNDIKKVWVADSLRPFCPGIARKVKHSIVGIWDYLARGKRSVRIF
jgi:glycosyltransferase involved in cell wall biosynthesis